MPFGWMDVVTPDDLPRRGPVVRAVRTIKHESPVQYSVFSFCIRFSAYLSHFARNVPLTSQNKAPR
jgi:hypothetical protein